MNEETMEKIDRSLMKKPYYVLMERPARIKIEVQSPGAYVAKRAAAQGNR